MFYEIPFYLSVGFCCGVFSLWLGDVVALLKSWDENANNIGIIATFLLLLSGAFLAFLMASHGRFAFELYLSAGVVGLAAGRWFVMTEWGWDKLVFIAAGGVIVMLGALEYQYRSLEHVTKVGAGSVNLEFAAAQKADTNAGSFLAPFVEQSNPFLGRYRLDFAISQLKDLPDMIWRDEIYAEMFSGFVVERAKDPNLKIDQEKGPWPLLDRATGDYAQYFCGEILPFVRKLKQLHNFHKGEVSTSMNLKPEVTTGLRLAYERMLSLTPTGQSPQEFLSGDMEFPNAIKRAMKAVDYEIEIITPYLAKPSPPEKGFCNLLNPSPGRISDLSASGQFTSTDAYTFATYFAMTAALAEFAMDNRERAIQLLDDVIVNGSPYDRKELKDQSHPLAPELSPALTQCKQVDPKELMTCQRAAVRLQDSRRRVARARLETLEDNIIEIAGNPGLTAIRISLLNRAIRDGDAAIAPSGERSEFDLTSFFGAESAASKFGCALGGREASGYKRLSIARWMVGEITLRANALQSASDRPDVVNIDQTLVPTLDDYAKSVASFDFDCAEGLVPEVKDRTWRAALLASVAAYWEAKGNGFGATESEGSHLTELGAERSQRIEALCKASKFYQQAEQFHGPRILAISAEDDKATLDDRGRAYLPPTDIAKIKLGRARTLALLGNFPTADTDRACH